MAKMHGRGKGISRSRKPLVHLKPSWISHTEKEVELLISKHAKEGKNPANIGLHLRDTYGIPSVKLITGKKLGTILKEKKLTEEYPEDMMNLMKRSVTLHKHLEENHKDMSAKRGYQLTRSKLLRLAKYYKNQGKLTQNWKFNIDDLKLIASD